MSENNASKPMTGSVMVIGGGIAGIQSALDLADAGYYVYLVERQPSIGGVMAQLDKTFPTNDCAMCILSPKLVEVGRHLNIELLTLSEVQHVSGRPGNFAVKLLQTPGQMDVSKCCGECARCHHPCESIFMGTESNLKLNVGAIIAAPGLELFNPSSLDTYAYSQLPNVVTSMEFERILSFSGPTRGQLSRPSDHKQPQKIAWLQCVGSRDIQHCGHKYCSGVCCMYAIKQAAIAGERSGGNLDASIFYIDVRTHGKDFERYYNRAKDQPGVRFIRSRVHTIDPVPVSDDLRINYVTEDGVIESERFDMVVLSVGLETSDSVKELARRLALKLNDNGFSETSSFNPVSSNRPGVFVCGSFQSPKDIPQSLMDAGAAAASAASLLAPVRGTMSTEKVRPPQLDGYVDRPRIGVFVCNCGINIGGIIDVKTVGEYAKSLPYVEYVTDDLYTCSLETQTVMRSRIKEHDLNRIVVAACTPQTHESLFQNTLTEAGLNKYLFEMTNIRNHDSWVHNSTPELATAKAKDLVRMAVFKAALLEPLQEHVLGINQKALVIGGGVAGMSAAKAIADQGYPVHLIERETQLGGQALNLYRTWRHEDIQSFVKELARSVVNHPNITLHLSAGIVDVEGFVGNFKTTVRGNRQIEENVVIEHGVALIATGGKAFTPDQYGYGEDPRILTHFELDRRFMRDDPDLKTHRLGRFHSVRRLS